MKKNLKDVLPSKQFVRSLGVVLGIMVLILGIGFLVNRKSTYTKSGLAKPIVVKDLIDSDSDNDGLADWEEAIWGLDPSNPDTNGNGISDKDELAITQERLKTATSTGLDASSESETGLKTDSFAEQVVKLVSALQASGQLGSENQDAVADQVRVYAENGQPTQTYSAKDIKTVRDSKAAIDTYAQGFAQALKINPISDDDINLLTQFDPDQFELLQTRYSAASTKYQTLLTSLTNIPIPESMVFEHVAFLNVVLDIKDTFDKYKLLDVDPIVTMQKYVQVPNILSTLSSAMDSLLTQVRTVYNKY
jgi:hypothetical protein